MEQVEKQATTSTNPAPHRNETNDHLAAPPTEPVASTFSLIPGMGSDSPLQAAADELKQNSTSLGRAYSDAAPDEAGAWDEELNRKFGTLLEGDEKAVVKKKEIEKENKNETEKDTEKEKEQEQKQDNDENVTQQHKAELAGSIYEYDKTNPTKPKSAPAASNYLVIEPAYVDPTPSTPYSANSRSSAASRDSSPDGGNVDKKHANTIVNDDEGDVDDDEQGSRAELASIMTQFSADGGGPGEDEVMSPRLEIAGSMVASPVTHSHPPRRSSLEVASQAQIATPPRLSVHSSMLQHQQQHHSRSSTVVSPVAASTTPTLPASTATSTQPLPHVDEKITSEKQVNAPGAEARQPSWADDDMSDRRSLSDKPPVPPKDTPRKATRADLSRHPTDLPASPMSPSTLSIHTPRLPPPDPEPEPTQTFDFHRFLEQLRNKKADPVARYLKSFLSEFGKKQWMVHEQVKIISDFLTFIAHKMAQCDVWKNASDSEFDHAREGMEKLVMNRLYTQTFSPAIPAPQPMPGSRSLRGRKGVERPMGPGRRGQHQEDVERDGILTQKIKIYSWVREEHLDIPPIGDSGKKFLKLAQQDANEKFAMENKPELLKIKSYRAPRDKIICVLNCCKVIFGLLRHTKTDSSADSFMPLLIYVVLQANPEHLVSNVQYILRFRNQEKLGGEAGYYLSSLMGAIQFIESMAKTTLTISADEYDRNVEAAVSAIAEKHQDPLMSPQSPQRPPEFPSAAAVASNALEHEHERRRGPPSSSATSGMAGAAATTAGGQQMHDPEKAYHDHRRVGSSEDDDDDSDAPLTGILRTIQRPLSSIGRMFVDDSPGTSTGSHGSGGATSYPPRSLHRNTNSPGSDGAYNAALNPQPQSSSLQGLPPPGAMIPASDIAHLPPSVQAHLQQQHYQQQPQPPPQSPQHQHQHQQYPFNYNQQHYQPPHQQARHRIAADVAAARQASAEAAEAQRIQRAEHANVVETLAGMFPGLDREVISDVVHEKQGRVGLAVDACLALSS